MRIMNILGRGSLILLLSLLMSIVHAEKKATAIFAAGCFWCAEHDFEHVPGVIEVISGYTGGQLKNPTYVQVSDGGTGHYEAIKVTYDADKISYKQLLDIFWKNEDPVDASGQFCDQGDQYRAVIFYQNAEEKKLAELSKKQWVDSGRFKQVVTQILPASTFYPAEEYHQNFADKNPLRYKFYRYNCGRDQRLKQLWK